MQSSVSRWGFPLLLIALASFVLVLVINKEVFSYWFNEVPAIQSFKTMFISIILEALPFVLLGVLLSSLLHVFVSERLISRLIPKNPLIGIITASSLGLLIPVCECGMIPVVRRLMRKGMPLYMAVVFILTGPIINPVVFWATFEAFRSRPELAYSRIGLAFAVAGAVGLLIYIFVSKSPLKPGPEIAGRLPKQNHFHQHIHTGHAVEHAAGHEHAAGYEHGHGHGYGYGDRGRHHPHKHGEVQNSMGDGGETIVRSHKIARNSNIVRGSEIKNNKIAGSRERAGTGKADNGHAVTAGRNKLLSVLSHAADEFFEMGKYLIFGSILAALIQTFMARESLVAIGQGEWSSHLFMMAFAFIVSLCSTSDAFVAASFGHTFTAGSLLTFLVFGPMIDMKGTLMLLSIFKMRFVILLIVLVAVFVMLGSMIWEQVFL